MSSKTITIIIILIVFVITFFFFIQQRSFDLPAGETVRLSDQENGVTESKVDTTDSVTGESQDFTSDIDTDKSMLNKSDREIFVTDGVKHSIPVNEIQRGCFGRDCIPSVDDPVFISISEAEEILPTDTIGIGLVFNSEERFYPFNMLVTREIVNDEVGGQPIVVTYCPLCGTGIVFDRVVEGQTFEFGVSGMLWQSNLIMYNRESSEDDISLWSQVLGEAVLGTHTGIRLTIIPSDIVRFTDWKESHPKSSVLNTGRIGDPYNGDYYGVARRFQPNFDEDNSPLPPTAYIFGINLNGEFKAYLNDALKVGTTEDSFAGANIKIEKKADGMVRIFEDGSDTPLPIITGFWFSWVAAHPETELYK